MDEYMVELGGYEYAVQAASPEEARQKALVSHVKAVGQQSVQQAETGAVGRSEAPAETRSPWAESAMAGMSGEGGAYADPNATGGEILSRAGGQAAMLSAGPIASGLVAAPVATGKAILGGLAGSAIGNEAGDWVGNRVPGIGGDLLGKILGGAGGLVGGGVGGVVAPKLGMKQVLSMLPGKGGMLADMMGAGRGAATAVEGATGAAEAAAARAAMAERTLAIKEAESAARIADRARLTDARIARIEAGRPAKAPGVPKAVSKPAPSAAPPTEGATALQPEPEFIDPSAVKVLPFPPAKGTVKPATNLGGAAKPGPARTPPDKLEETLQATLDGLKAKKGAVRGKSPVVDKALDTAEGMHQRSATAGMTERVAARRKAEGSQKVARELGMERHQVQSDAGTILNEALGEVSPVIPEARWAEIVTKMKSLPPEERTAYVARARGVKNMAQIENLRRTLETLGLLLPVGVAAGVTTKD
jgi:hypothetical protein